MRSPCLLLAVALSASLLAAAPGRGAEDLCAPVRAGDADSSSGRHLVTETARVGVIDLYFQIAGGPPVTFYECVRGRARKLGTATYRSGEMTGLPGAVPWLCDRRQREFRSTTTLESGQVVRGGATTLTPSCAHRFTLSAPARVKRGEAAKVTLNDAWGSGGLRTRLCISAPSRARRCREVAFAAAESVRSVRFRARERGVYRLDLRVRGSHVRGTVAAAVKAPKVKRRPVLLATGDSTMNGVGTALGDHLGGFSVQPLVLPGAEISDQDWPAFARAQVKRYRPAVTVVSIGATEGFPMTAPDGTTSKCCGPAWIAEYTRRVRATMRTYLKSGRVYWATIALSRDPARAAIVRVCNQAFVDAANDLPGVTVLRMDRLFTPNGYQETIRDGGRAVRIREDDGVHLNASGTAIEAREIAKAIRAHATTRVRVRRNAATMTPTSTSPPKIAAPRAAEAQSSPR
jgi:lysophospholipase L1-like esterase